MATNARPTSTLPAHVHRTHTVSDLMAARTAGPGSERIGGVGLWHTPSEFGAEQAAQHFCAVSHLVLTDWYTSPMRGCGVRPAAGGSCRATLFRTWTGSDADQRAEQRRFEQTRDQTADLLREAWTTPTPARRNGHPLPAFEAGFDADDLLIPPLRRLLDTVRTCALDNTRARLRIQSRACPSSPSTEQPSLRDIGLNSDITVLAEIKRRRVEPIGSGLGQNLVRPAAPSDQVRSQRSAHRAEYDSAKIGIRGERA